MEIIAHSPVGMPSKTSLKFLLLSLNCTNPVLEPTEKLVYLSTSPENLPVAVDGDQRRPRTTPALHVDNVRL